MCSSDLVLLYIDLRLAVNVWQERAALGRRSGKKTADTWVGGCQTLVWNGREIRLRFQERDFALSTRSLLLLSLIVGLVGGIYGIGGGAIMSPFLVSLFGLPVYVVVSSQDAGILISMMLSSPVSTAAWFIFTTL